MSRMASASELRSFWMRSSCSESLRFRSINSVCSTCRPEIWRLTYQASAITAASVITSPISRPTAGERGCRLIARGGRLRPAGQSGYSRTLRRSRLRTFVPEITGAAAVADVLDLDEDAVRIGEVQLWRPVLRAAAVLH